MMKILTRPSLTMKTLLKKINNTTILIITIIIDFYKKIISPFLPNACRFKPTCSEYMKEAILIHGILKGFYLGIRRILRCHPWGKSGFDPVPPKRPKNNNKRAN